LLAGFGSVGQDVKDQNIVGADNQERGAVELVLAGFEVGHHVLTSHFTMTSFTKYNVLLHQ